MYSYIAIKHTFSYQLYVSLAADMFSKLEITEQTCAIYRKNSKQLNSQQMLLSSHNLNSVTLVHCNCSKRSRSSVETSCPNIYDHYGNHTIFVCFMKTLLYQIYSVCPIKVGVYHSFQPFQHKTCSCRYQLLNINLLIQWISLIKHGS